MRIDPSWVPEGHLRRPPQNRWLWTPWCRHGRGSPMEALPSRHSTRRVAGGFPPPSWRPRRNAIAGAVIPAATPLGCRREFTPLEYAPRQLPLTVTLVVEAILGCFHGKATANGPNRGG